MNLIPQLASARRMAFLLASIGHLLGMGALGNWAGAQTVANPGFNDNSGWTLVNDATLAYPGGVAPWSWNTPVSATKFVHSTEDVLPLEGSGLGITYAGGGDSFTQSVLFPSSGLYTFSVDAKAISGTISFSSTVGGNTPMVNGLFAFFADGASSPNKLVATASGWNNYQWTTFISAGERNVGLGNTLTSVYAIAYDNFAIIPEPSTSGLLVIALVVAGLRRVRCRNSTCRMGTPILATPAMITSKRWM